MHLFSRASFYPCAPTIFDKPNNYVYDPTRLLNPKHHHDRLQHALCSLRGRGIGLGALLGSRWGRSLAVRGRSLRLILLRLNRGCGGGGSGAVSLLLPLGGPGVLRVGPWANVAELAALAGALARAAEGLGQGLGGDVLQQLLLVAAAEDVDLLHGDGVDPTLDGAPDGGEAPGGVDDEQLAETLGVVVLRHVGGRLEVAVNGGGLAEADALEVHDGAACLEQVTGLAGTCGQARVGDALVLDGKVGQHALRSGDLVHGGDVDLAQLLDVDWAAILSACCVSKCSNTADHGAFHPRRFS